MIELRGAEPDDAPAIAEIWAQVYVGSAHRSGGVADVLMNHAERRVAAAGHHVAWLAVVGGNTRARRFYERRGWSDDGLFDHQAPSDQGPITVPSHRYIKRVSPDSD